MNKRLLIRRILLLATCVLSFYVLVPQFAHARETVRSAQHASLPWLGATLLMSFMTYVGAGLSVVGATGNNVPFLRTWSAQVAGTFTNRLLPAGIGAMTTNVLYLTKAGLSKPSAVAAITLDTIGGFVVHLSAFLVAAAVTHRSTHLHLFPSDPDVPDRYETVFYVVVVMTMLGIVKWGRKIHHHAYPPIRDAVVDIVVISRQPAAFFVLMFGSTLITLSYLLAFVFATKAFDMHISTVTLAFIYLGASAIAAATPTPGGLGAIEAAMVAGLTAAGAASAPAVACILTYRLITYWLPAIPGAAIYTVMRRRSMI